MYIQGRESDRGRRASLLAAFLARLNPFPTTTTSTKKAQVPGIASILDNTLFRLLPATSRPTLASSLALDTEGTGLLLAISL